MNSEHLDKIGKFLIEHIRDSNIDEFDRLVDHQSSFVNRKLRLKVQAEFTSEQLLLIRKVVIYCIDNMMTQLLWNLEKSNNKSDVSICVENQSVSDEDHYLQSMYYSDEGWIARFSKHYDEDDV